ncbi:hypothetical protein CKAH01_11582 [Colletotrichum kahawae]|uniref:Uncharacterized protein n=1 Tax=Colletotrichum kahawae TaxID=34407 RepID=A0AAD9YXK0_COLKA|nr:hypothetical protein CKAH01_11582 [Colletotrichum kahawae]
MSPDWVAQCLDKPASFENTDIGGIGAILVLSDVQLLTGLGILVSGYINLVGNAITAYHWRILVYLVWFSNLTHTSSLTLLRGYLNYRPMERTCRLGLMFVLWGGLLAAFIPTWWFGWFSGDPTGLGAANARCFYSPAIAKNVTVWQVCQLESANATSPNFTAEECMKHTSYDDAWYMYSTGLAETSALTSMILIFLGFFMRLVKITSNFSSGMNTIFRTKPSNWLLRNMAKRTDNSTKGRFGRCFAYNFLVIEMTWYLFTKSYVNLVSSDLIDITQLVVSFTWGTIRIIRSRASVKVNENEWGFGQILPVFLLIGPLAGMLTPILANITTTLTNSVRSHSDSLDTHERSSLNSNVPNTTELSMIRDPINQRQSSNDQQLRSFQEDATASGYGSRTSVPEAGHLTSGELPLQLDARMLEASESHTNLIPLSNMEIETRASPSSLYDLLLWQRTNSLNHRRLEPQQLKTYLHSHHSQSKWMKQVNRLICAQLFVSIGFFILMVVVADAASLGVFYCLPQTLIMSPLNCLYFTAVDLFLGGNHILRKELFSFPLNFWGLLITQATPLLLLAYSVWSLIIFVSVPVVQLLILFILSLLLGLVYFQRGVRRWVETRGRAPE